MSKLRQAGIILLLFALTTTSQAQLIEKKALSLAAAQKIGVEPRTT